MELVAEGWPPSSDPIQPGFDCWPPADQPLVGAEREPKRFYADGGEAGSLEQPPELPVVQAVEVRVGVDRWLVDSDAPLKELESVVQGHQYVSARSHDASQLAHPGEGV